MGSWSRAVGSIFLDWVAPPADARWLDVGCGTGIFTELVIETCAPSAIFGVDPTQAQIVYARLRPFAQRGNFWVANAQALPFRNSTFDIVASALVINFIRDRPQALAEMRRVTRRGGGVSGYVWDYTAELAPSSPLRVGLRRGRSRCSVGPRCQWFVYPCAHRIVQAGRPRKDRDEVNRHRGVFPSFDDFWSAQTPRYNPIGPMIARMTARDRSRLVELVRARLSPGVAGRIEYSARANAVKAHVPD